MKRTVKALLGGDEKNCRAVRELLQSTLVEHQLEYRYEATLEGFEMALVDWAPTLVVVVADGAIGMEYAYRTSRRKPMLPIFWFSDDSGFALQSHRLNCAYFSTKPPTAEKLQSAFRRCDHIGLQYDFGG